MAPIVRRTWADIRTEVLRRLGKENATATTFGRAEQAVNDAYYVLSLTYHHYELHTTDTTPVLAAGARTVDLPSDVYVVIGVRAGTRWLTHRDLRSTLPPLSSTPPGSYARTRNAAGTTHQLLFDSPAPVGGLPIEIRYYRVPSAADFVVGSPETSWLWDRYIIEMALTYMYPSLYRFDFRQVAATTLQEFLAQQIQAPLNARDVPEQTLTDEALGGRQ